MTQRSTTRTVDSLSLSSPRFVTDRAGSDPKRLDTTVCLDGHWPSRRVPEGTPRPSDSFPRPLRRTALRTDSAARSRPTHSPSTRRRCVRPQVEDHTSGQILGERPKDRLALEREHELRSVGQREQSHDIDVLLGSTANAHPGMLRGRELGSHGFGGELMLTELGATAAEDRGYGLLVTAAACEHEIAGATGLSRIRSDALASLIERGLAEPMATRRVASSPLHPVCSGR